MPTKSKESKAFIMRIIGYTVIESIIAYLTDGISWYLPVFFSSLFLIGLEVVYQLFSLNNSIEKLNNRLPKDISSLEPAVSTYIRKIDDKRRDLVNSAISGSIELDGTTSEYLTKQLDITTNFFYAISPIEQDIELWNSSKRRGIYINSQLNAINRHVEIRRIFVGLALHEVYEEAAAQQREGIQVRFLEKSNREIQDMAIFDSSLVYYSNNGEDSKFSTQKGVISEKLTTFNYLWSLSTEIQKSPPLDDIYGLEVYTEKDSSFGSKSLLDAWNKNINTGAFMTPAISDSGYREFLLELCKRSCTNNTYDILSIGSGTGSFEELLRDKLSAKLTCIELLDEGVKILQDKNFETIQTTCTDLTLLRDIKYDLILIDGLIVHLGDISLKKMLKETMKHLKTETGRIIISNDAPKDSNLRSEAHKRVKHGVLRSQATIVAISEQIGLQQVANTPTEFPYYRPSFGYTKRAIAVLQKHSRKKG